MTTINDIHDLANILEEHPEWRAELRRLLLTEDLLKMPERLNNLTTTVDELATTVADLSAKVDELATTVADLTARVDELTTTVEKLADTSAVLMEMAIATNRRLDGIDTRLDGIDTRLDGIDTRLDTFREETNQRFNRVEANIGDLKGHFMERQAREDAYAIAALMNLEWVATLPKGITITIWLEAESAGLTEGIGRDDGRSFRNVDLVIEALNPQGERNYVVVESSYTANGRDTQRAIRNAEYLNLFTGLSSFPAIASVRIDNRVRDRVAEYEEWTSDSQKVFWYQFPEMTSPR